jgi:acyl dehydratase
MSTKEHYGRYLDEFTVGETIDHWPGRTITETDDVLFCALTMNQHPLHSDAAYAQDTQFGDRIVAGPFVYSLVFGMTVDIVSGKAIANLATTDMKHTAPVHHGDTVYARTEVLNVRDSSSQPDRGIVTVRTEGINQDGLTVLTFQRAVMIPKRP